MSGRVFVPFTKSSEPMLYVYSWVPSQYKLLHRKIQYSGQNYLPLFEILSYYRKNSKNWDTWNNYHNCPTIVTVGFYSAVLCSKDADRITNREDPDQTAPWGAVWSGSALFAQTYLSQYLKLLRYILWKIDASFCFNP